MLHLAKVQKNFDSERTVNFPARKPGNLLRPVKILKNDGKTSRQIINSKIILNPNVGANDILQPKNWQTKKAIKTLT